MTESRAEDHELVVGGVSVPPGRQERIEIPLAKLPTDTSESMPLSVLHGLKPGPRLWICAAIHGDEVNGVEIIRRVLKRVSPDKLRGALIAVPVVNVFGFLFQNRYLPDRRDLNRSFPGSKGGSLASQMAHLFLRDVVDHCQYGVDLHTGSGGRDNLPQIRANLEDEETRRLAEGFGVPMLLHSALRDGSLRASAMHRGKKMLVYEAGMAGRFDEAAIRVGVRGILRVMSLLGMRASRPADSARKSLVAKGSRWIRARRGGILHLEVALGHEVSAKDRLGIVTTPLGDSTYSVLAPSDGVIIGLNRNPLVHRGDALAHIARV